MLIKVDIEINNGHEVGTFLGEVLITFPEMNIFGRSFTFFVEESGGVVFLTIYRDGDVYAKAFYNNSRSPTILLAENNGFGQLWLVRHICNLISVAAMFLETNTFSSDCFIYQNTLKTPLTEIDDRICGVVSMMCRQTVPK